MTTEFSRGYKSVCPGQVEVRDLVLNLPGLGRQLDQASQYFRNHEDPANTWSKGYFWLSTNTMAHSINSSERKIAQAFTRGFAATAPEWLNMQSLSNDSGLGQEWHWADTYAWLSLQGSCSQVFQLCLCAAAAEHLTDLLVMVRKSYPTYLFFLPNLTKPLWPLRM